jgi:hypothetical protein
MCINMYTHCMCTYENMFFFFLSFRQYWGLNSGSHVLYHLSHCTSPEMSLIDKIFNYIILSKFIIGIRLIEHH